MKNRKITRRWSGIQKGQDEARLFDLAITTDNMSEQSVQRICGTPRHFRYFSDADKPFLTRYSIIA